MSFYVGDIWRPLIKTTDGETKTPVDVGTLSCEVIKPSGKTESATPTHKALGEYRPAITLTEAGWWRVNAISSTGEYQGVESAHIIVEPVPTTSG